MTTVTIRIEGFNLPGRRCVGLPGIAKPVYENVHVGVQQGRDVVNRVPGDAATASWELELAVVTGRDGNPDLRGPWVHGKPGDRFLYLSWGECDALGHFDSFRRAKLMLGTIDAALVHEAVAGGSVITARLPLTDARGGPICAAVRPPTIQWSLADD